MLEFAFCRDGIVAVADDVDVADDLNLELLLNFALDGGRDGKNSSTIHSENCQQRCVIEFADNVRSYALRINPTVEGVTNGGRFTGKKQGRSV